MRRIDLYITPLDGMGVGAWADTCGQVVGAVWLDGEASLQ